ncbi:tyrosine-protein phosphatase [Streptacidiphilus sp. P02-A3a]|uniref:tyrosine-protein phosphatase n=1 Tax=Streptacidiphilus sp. P02-A3a TaxID=2704468 RepID=UPI0015FA01AE|nr:tyrosine-protein phosphatase [Streptacidiphilus sp. P02-A3a]QMU67568.1 tyrosine-protein phosphatase [Streptacidiphilus sp. P02-A3a]
MTTPQSRRTARVLGSTVLASALALGVIAGTTAEAGAATVPHAQQAAATPSWARPHAAHPIPFTAATVTDNANGSYTISWTAPGVHSVAIYAGSTEDRIDYRRPVAWVAGSGTITIPAKDIPAAGASKDRQWFRLAPAKGEGLTLADRSLHLAGAPNFRDAGGYRTADGAWVKMGVIYRSGDMSKLSAADLAELRRLGIHTVYDLRTDAEVKAAPDQVPAGAKDIQENILGAASTAGFTPTTPAAATAEMIQAEVTMVDAQSAQTGYHNVLTGIADSKDLAVVYHCSAGKDRTGWASAVLLTALGVPRATVEADYLASNTYNAAYNKAVLASLPPAYQAVYQPLLAVTPAYLASGFNTVKAQYGSFSAYLDKGLGLDARTLNELRANLLVG